MYLNKARRKILRQCLKSLQDSNTIEKCEDIKMVLEDILCEEDESRDNMPEGLENSDKYYLSEEASELIEGSIEQVSDAILSMEIGDDEGAKRGIKEAIELLSGVI